MVDRETFDLIKKRHGSYASWAGLGATCAQASEDIATGRCKIVGP